MCGICGIIQCDPCQKVDRSLVQKMSHVLDHRGPDGEGIYAQGSVGLGHRRLKVMDLSSDASQPMCNKEKNIWIVFNGEIYNFLRLRRELEQQGYEFISRSDTEVLLYLYEKEGIECLEKLRGMFAFAIWDERKQILFIARDRVGKKPLFYTSTKDAFLFASEIKSLLQHHEVKRESNPMAIHHYLTYQYVPSPLCAFSGIHKLPAAHYLVWKDNKIHIQQYWRLSYLPKWPASTKREKENLEKRLWEKIEESVCLRMNSDVPLGVLLSGGLDSSIVVAMMRDACPKEDIKTFSIAFSDHSYDESSYARLVSERFHTTHTEFCVEPDFSILPRLVWHYNEPYADSSAIATYYVCKLARQHVTVVLTGDGGDENFAGYDRYKAIEWCRKLHPFFPSLSAKMLHSLLLAFPCGHSKGMFWKLQKFLEGYSNPVERAYWHWMSYFTPDRKQRLYSKDFASQVSSSDCFELFWQKHQECQVSSPLERILYSDVSLYLPDDLLVKMDIASMANSLEARSPFLDHKLMEFTARLPIEWKLSKNTGKYILKKLYKDILPQEVLNRKKMGFAVPLDKWLRHELKEMAEDTLLSAKALQRGYFRKDFIETILKQHSSHKWNWQHQIYSLLMLELWHQQFIDSP